MVDSKILTERRGNVAIIRLNDPATFNALSPPVVIELRDSIREAEQDAGAIMLAGGTKAFCSGANLAAGGEEGVRPGELDAGLALEDYINPLVMALRDCRIPVVTAIRGAVAGVGVPLALIGDIIVAGRSAYFALAFSKIGLVPDGGAAWLLARSVGRVRAMELMLLGGKIGAEEAQRCGMITRVVDDEAAEEAAFTIARQLADGPTTALQLTRKAAWSAVESGFENQLRAERWLQREAGYHPDFAEGVAAFLEKRVPRFGRRTAEHERSGE